MTQTWEVVSRPGEHADPPARSPDQLGIRAPHLILSSSLWALHAPPPQKGLGPKPGPREAATARHWSSGELCTTGSIPERPLCWGEALRAARTIDNEHTESFVTLKMRHQEGARQGQTLCLIKQGLCTRLRSGKGQH